ncbi:DUF5799 family protein [Halostella sp. PRR32]|uniref:DUF5799 family protein n=1 Tax=Halostella sp. PRR32 TaxID=3098147 RepID=UPI002B1E5976|nr:DUF5799 family protein [Halostella sp. PRR32]
MTDSEWTDRIVGDRMAVDQEFSQHVQNSRFSNQEWGMIMTAVELDIENPDDPEAARIVAVTDNIDQVMPAIEEARSKMGGMGAGGGGGPSGGARSGSSEGFLSGIKDALGLGGSESGGDGERAEAAATLAQEYADELQAHLEQKGKWEEVRTAAQG